MSAGRDVRGIKRGHEFDKVEMVVHSVPEDSPKWLERMTELAVQVLERLELPVRHTLNASGLALPRLMIAIMENYQQPDGSLAIPHAVRSYPGGRERIAPGEFAL